MTYFTAAGWIFEHDEIFNANTISLILFFNQFKELFLYLQNSVPITSRGNYCCAQGQLMVSETFRNQIWIAHLILFNCPAVR